MADKSKQELFEWLPGIFGTGRRAVVPIDRVAAIKKIVTRRANRSASERAVFLPSTRVVVTENSDGSYAVLNDLTPLHPELTRIASKSLEVTVLDLATLDPDRCEEEAIRSFLLHVVPYRRVGGNSDIAKMSSQGLYDSLHSVYGTERSEAGKYTAVSSQFPTKQIARSTFERILAEQKDPSKKTVRNAKNNKRRRRKKKAKKGNGGNDGQDELF